MEQIREKPELELQQFIDAALNKDEMDIEQMKNVLDQLSYTASQVTTKM